MIPAKCANAFLEVRDLSSLVKRTAAPQAGMDMVDNTEESEPCLASQTDSPTFIFKSSRRRQAWERFEALNGWRLNEH